MEFRADTSEVDALAAQLAAAGAKAKAESSTALTKVGGELRDAARGDAPVRTGDLAGSITMTGGGNWRRVSTGVRYARFVEWGTYKDAPQPFMMPNAARAHAQLFGEMAKIGDPFK
jgi:HK97 gp10 family phage protein